MLLVQFSRPHGNCLEPLLPAKVYELEGPDLKTVKETEKKHSFKCGTFGASSLAERRLATGNFGGEVQIWDLENTAQPVFTAQAHASIVNAIDGCGGQVGRFLGGCG